MEQVRCLWYLGFYFLQGTQCLSPGSGGCPQSPGLQFLVSLSKVIKSCTCEQKGVGMWSLGLGAGARGGKQVSPCFPSSIRLHLESLLYGCFSSPLISP